MNSDSDRRVAIGARLYLSSIDVWIDGWIDRWMDGQMDRWMDGWMCIDV